MLGRKQEINLQFSQLLDLALVVLAFMISYAIRKGFPGFFLFTGEELPEFSEFYWQITVVAPFTPLVLEMFGFYEHPLQKRPWPWVSIVQMLKTLAVFAVFLGGYMVFSKKMAESRAVLGIVVFVAGALILAKESLVRGYVRRKVRKGSLKERVILAGPVCDVETLLQSLPKQQVDEWDIKARIDIDKQPVEDLVQALHDGSVERVIFAAGHMHFEKVQMAVSACEIEGVEAWVWTGFLKTAIARPCFDVLGGKPMLVFRSTPDASWELMGKNIIDRVGGLLIILATSPLWLLAFIGIKLQSPGPVFFTQNRSGKNGEPFKMWKFRSMGTDAEARRAELEAQNQMSGPVFKVERDPRIFPFGQFIRKTSIDELPQLINVVLGDMSLVGPRPLPVYEIEKIEEAAQRRRLSVKPGLTCLWQIGGRNKITDFQEWVELDLKYIDNWSLWLDIVILVKTVPAVLFGWGAK